MLSYRRYWLKNRNRKRGENVRNIIGPFERIIRHEMIDVKFSGVPSIEILRFLARFKSVYDEKYIYEQSALILLPKWLTGEAYENYTEQRDRGSGRNCHIETYPEAVNFLLGEYAKDSVIEDSVAGSESTRQEDEEDERKFPRRLKSKASVCANVYSDEELATRLLLVLRVDTKTVILVEIRKNPDTPFHGLVESAKAAGDAVTPKNYLFLFPSFLSFSFQLLSFL